MTRFGNAVAAALAAAGMAGAADPPRAVDPPGDVSDRDFIPGSGPVQTMEVSLVGDLAGVRLPVQVKQDGGRLWVYPVFAVEAVAVRAGQVHAVVRDCLNDADQKSAIETALAARFAGTVVQLAAPTTLEIRVGLTVNKNGKDVKVSSQSVSRQTGRKRLPLDPFMVDAETAARLARDGLRAAGLTFTAGYRGKHAVTDLEVTLGSARDAATRMANAISSDPKGQTATLLVCFGGTVEQNVAVQQLVRAETQLRVSKREGAEVAPELMRSLIDGMFAGLTETRKLDADADKEIVAFQFSNGFRLTSALGVFKALSDDQKKELETRVEAADASKNVLDAKLKIEGSFLGIGGGVEAGLRTEAEKSRVRNNARRDLAEFKKAIAGDLPVAALNVRQQQTLAKRAEEVKSVSLSSFSIGVKELSFGQSFEVLLDRLAPPPPPPPPAATPPAEKPAPPPVDRVGKALNAFRERKAAVKPRLPLHELWKLMYDAPMTDAEKDAALAAESKSRFGEAAPPAGKLDALRAELYGPPKTVGDLIKDRPPAPPRVIVPPRGPVGRGKL